MINQENYKHSCLGNVETMGKQITQQVYVGRQGPFMEEMGQEVLITHLGD